MFDWLKNLFASPFSAVKDNKEAKKPASKRSSSKKTVAKKPAKRGRPKKSK